MSEDETAARLAVHEAVCAERWKQASDRLARIEIVLAAIVCRAGYRRHRTSGIQTVARIRAPLPFSITFQAFQPSARAAQRLAICAVATNSFSNAIVA